MEMQVHIIMCFRKGDNYPAVYGVYDDKTEAEEELEYARKNDDAFSYRMETKIVQRLRWKDDL